MLKQAMKMTTRFAPSPTGYLHLGNIRTALFNALLAHRYQGTFLLRIEDTDPLRSSHAFIKAIQDDLSWLGLFNRQEDNTQFSLQSERYSIYQRYYHQLEKTGAAYPCFCTDKRLAKLRDTQRVHHRPSGYDGHCRQLSIEDINARKAGGDTYSLRFKIPKGETIVFDDLVKGHQRIKSEYLSDFVIQRSDKHPAFLYCNALDDALMTITHVLRGEDHLSNTARQYLILNALDLPMPCYGHLPLICHSNNSTPLSKRDNSLSLQSLRKQGYLPKAILNYLVRLGYTVPSKEALSLKELSQLFSIETIHTKPAHFDKVQLDFWQKQVIRQLSATQVWHLLSPLAHKVPKEKQAYFCEVIKEMMLLPIEADAWIEILFGGALNYLPESKTTIQSADPKVWSHVMSLFKPIHQQKDSDCELVVNRIKSYLKTLDKTQQRIHFKALRVALTNRFSGPDLLTLIHLLGISKTFKRLQEATCAL